MNQKDYKNIAELCLRLNTRDIDFGYFIRQLAEYFERESPLMNHKDGTNTRDFDKKQFLKDCGVN